MNPEQLRQFEAEIAALFEAGKIRAPVHLAGGNEEQLVSIFKDIKPTDWVCSTHRSHYHALLKGIPPEVVKQQILDNRSITLCNREHRFITSAIVGGIVPIATGLAMAGETVWCFVGDMAASTGIFQECVRYSWGHHLPIAWVIEDNGFSVETPTKVAWGVGGKWNTITHITYVKEYPHQGSGKWVTF